MWHHLQEITVLTGLFTFPTFCHLSVLGTATFCGSKGIYAEVRIMQEGNSL